jgi:hypothetical protein
MSKRVVDYDPFTGVTTYFDYDFATDKTTVGMEQDVTLVLEWNKALQNDDDYSKKGIKNEWWHMCKIPNIVIERWKNEKGIDVWNRDHWGAVKKLLNDPDYKWLKATSGYI